MKKLLLLFIIWVGIAQAQELRVFELHHTIASKMIPLIEPLLPTGSAISGQGQQLIIGANLQTLDQIRQLLMQLDVPSRDLTLSVRRIRNPGHDTKKALQGKVIVYDTQTRDRRDNTQQVTVENGQTAFITTGKSIPQRDYAFGILQIARYTHYRETQSGIMVTPTLINDRVQLKIQWKNQQLNDDRSQQLREISPTQNEAVNTVMTVPLGKWVNVGLTSTRNPDDRHKTTYDTANISHPNSDIYIKVDLISASRQFEARLPQALGSKFPTKAISH